MCLRVAGAALSSLSTSMRSSGYCSFHRALEMNEIDVLIIRNESARMVLPDKVSFPPNNLNDQGYSGRPACPSSMLPYTVQFIIFKNGRLRIGDVRFPLFLHIDASLAITFCGPSDPNIHLTVSNMCTHMSPVMPLPYSMNVRHHLSMGQSVVGPKGRGPCPHFVVKEVRDRLKWRIAVGAHMEIAAHLHVRYLAEETGIHYYFLCIDKVRGTFSSGPTCTTRLYLRAAATHGLAFHYIDADRFLHIYMGTRFERFDALQGMPVIWAADLHDIQLLSSNILR